MTEDLDSQTQQPNTDTPVDAENEQAPVTPAVPTDLAKSDDEHGESTAAADSAVDSSGDSTDTEPQRASEATATGADDSETEGASAAPAAEAAAADDADDSTPALTDSNAPGIAQTAAEAGDHADKAAASAETSVVTDGGDESDDAAASANLGSSIAHAGATDTGTDVAPNAAPLADTPIEVSSEEELDAVMDSMMDAVEAMKDAAAPADPEEAEAASSFVPGETPVADPGTTMPSFLQLEHPTIGSDAVEPHTAGFSVIEGGTGQFERQHAEGDTGRASVPEPSPAAEPQQPAGRQRDLGAAVADTANAVGTFIAQGASAMREMNAAKKALTDARSHLEELDRRISDQAEELETRQDIAARYPQIVKEQRAAILTAQKAEAAAEISRDEYKAKAEKLKANLAQVKEEDAQTEVRLKAAVDAVEARESSSRENGNRLTRRVEDARRIRDKVQAERDAGVAAAKQTVDAAKAQLQTLRKEYAELQRNPSANSANYTVRTNELSSAISDAADALRKAEEDLPRVTADLDHSLAAAVEAVKQAEAPIGDAKRAHQSVTTEADAARDELQSAKAAATERQRDLREQIAAADKARREQEQAMTDARSDAAHAQEVIDQATEVHEHPEVTEAVAGALARDRAEREEAEREVAGLETAEHTVRERTRESRIKFTGAIVCIIAIVAVVIVAWLFLTR